MTLELQKRIITSICLLALLGLMYFYTYILIISLIIIAIVCWVEFYALISKIFKKKQFKDKSLRFLYKMLSLLYLSSLVYLIIKIRLSKPELEILIFYSIIIGLAIFFS